MKLEEIVFLSAEDGEELAKIDKVKVLRNDQRQGESVTILARNVTQS